MDVGYTRFDTMAETYFGDDPAAAISLIDRTLELNPSFALG